MPCRPNLTVAPLLFTLALLTACQSQPPVGASDYPALDVHIAHINDHHSHLEPGPEFDLKIDGVATRTGIGGFPRIAALFRESATRPNLLKIHAGDATTGTLYHTLYKGEADAALMNTICFDALVPGNHEFDEGDAGLRRFLDYLRSGPCATTVIGANVEPALGTPLAPTARHDYLQPYLLKRFGEVTVALIGIVTRGKTVASSRPLPTTRFDDEATSAQRTIDELKARGIRHFILVTHQGYAADQAMAAQLSDVDVIIGGDSHTLLGDFSALGLKSAGPYPTVVRNRDGDPVCIGQAWEYGKAFGLMQVRFDRRGAVEHCAGSARLVLGDDLQQADGAGRFAALDAKAATMLRRRLAGEPAIAQAAPDPLAQSELARFSRRLAGMKGQTIGEAREALCLVRVPGEDGNRSAGLDGCAAANTLARGSDIAQVVAEAYRQASRQADIALQNGGGIRSGLPKGEVTFNTAYTVLPFSNTLVELRLNGGELIAVLEEAVANHLDDRGSNGSHPYAAGLRWDLDMSRTRGERFSRLEVLDRASGEWRPLDRQRTYTVVTSDYLASGGDGYRQLAAIHRSGRGTETYLLYTQTFIDYLQALGTLARPTAGEYSHQRVITKSGSSLRSEVR